MAPWQVDSCPRAASKAISALTGAGRRQPPLVVLSGKLGSDAVNGAGEVSLRSTAGVTRGKCAAVAVGVLRILPDAVRRAAVAVVRAVVVDVHRARPGGGVGAAWRELARALLAVPLSQHQRQQEQQ